MAQPGSMTATTAAAGSSMNPASIPIVRVGLKSAPFADLYHDVLTMPWRWFLLALFTAQIAVNGLFAVLYALDPGSISNARGLVDSFYFSVQTWATIGYGGMTPTTTWSNMLVVCESAVSTIFTALTTGLVFAKFARPNVRVLFSNVMVMTKRDGKNVLMFRVANERGNYVVQASASVSVLSDEVSAEGERMRRVRDLKLTRLTQPIFLFSWTVMHEVEADSPLFGVSAEDFVARRLRLTVSLTAFDGTLSQTIHASHLYQTADVRFDSRFVDVMSILPDGSTQLDFSRFHDVIAVPR